MRERRIRFSPQEECFITLSSDECCAKGLLRDESFNGCCVIFNKIFPFQEGDDVDVCMGELGKYEGKIAWVKEFDDVLVKVGVMLQV